MQIHRPVRRAFSSRSGALLAVALAGVAALAVLPGCGGTSSHSSDGSGGSGGGGDTTGSGGKGSGGDTTGSGGKGSGGKGSGGANDGGGDGGAGESGTGGQAPSDTNVRGQVVDGAGRPLAGARVLIDGRVLTTSKAGTFEADDVPDEYDLVVLPKDAHVVTVWQGVTLRNPTATAQVPHDQPYVNIKGNVWGDGSFDAATNPTEVGYLCDDGSRLAEPYTGGAFEIDVVWKQWGSVKCRLMARRQTLTGGVVTATEVGFLELELSDEEPLQTPFLTDQNIQLEPVTLTERLVVIDRYPSHLTTLAYWGPFRSGLRTDIATADLVVFGINVTGTEIPVFVEATSGGLLAEFSSAKNTGPVGIDFWDAVDELTPADGSVVPPDQTFVARRHRADVPRGVYAFHFTDASGFEVHVLTGEETSASSVTTGSVNLSALAALDVELASPIEWRAKFVDSPGSVDAALGDHAPPLFSFTSTTSHFSWE